MSSSLDTLTNNPARSEAILEVVREAINDGAVTLSHTSTKCARFGELFDPLLQSELDAALGMLRPAEFDPNEVTPTQGANPDAPAAVQPPTMTRDQAAHELKARQEALHAARNERMIADHNLRTARTAMALAIGEWSASGGTYTQEMLARDTIRANQQYKIDVKEGRIEPVVRGGRRLRSRLDQIAAYSSGGDAHTYVEHRHRYGGSLHRPIHMADGSVVRPGKRS